MNTQTTTTTTPRTTAATRRTRKTKWATGAAAILALGLVSATAHAVLLSSNGMVSTFGTSASTRPVLSGVYIYTSSVPFSATSGGYTLKGKVIDRVMKEAAGNLTFYHQIVLDPATNVVVYTEDWQRFADPTQTYFSDVDWRTDFAGNVPTMVAGGPSAQVVRFLFPYLKTPGTPAILTGGVTSRYHFVRTNAPGFDKQGNTTLYAVDPATGDTVSVSVSTTEPTGTPVLIP